MADNAPRGRAKERRRKDEGKAEMMKVSSVATRENDHAGRKSLVPLSAMLTR